MRDGKPVLVRLPELNFIDDKEGKPVGIQSISAAGPSPRSAIPTATCKCSNGQPPAAGRGSASMSTTRTPSANGPTTGSRLLRTARQRRSMKPQAKGWTVVDMKNDWNTIFAFEKTNPVTAIDILLEPDATMLRHAQANNARLLKVFPKGFALDEAHRPHITLIQRFVRTEDLDQVYAAAEKVLAGANVTRMKLEAFKYYYVPGKDIGLAGIVVKPTPALLKLQQELIAAVAPFTVETGAMAAFTAPHDDPALDAILIEYVSTFVPKAGRRAFQSARQHRGRPPGLPRQNARRTV